MVKPQTPSPGNITATMPFPLTLNQAVADALAAIGDRSELRRLEPVYGGMVSKGWRLGTRRSTYFFKHSPPGATILYSREVDDLELLRCAGADVPAAFSWADSTDALPGYLMLEWLNPERTREATARRIGAPLGEMIAGVHSAEPAKELCGDTAHRTSDDWPIHFATVRLLPLVRWVDQLQRLPGPVLTALYTLADKVPSLLNGVPRRRSLLHGDLHARNVLCRPSGSPVLVDPSCHIGDREEEMAYTYLYQVFPPIFYAAYNALLPLNESAKERRDLYMLRGMLLNLTAAPGHFEGAITAIVRKYVGGTQ